MVKLSNVKLFSVSDTIEHNALITPWSLVHFLFGLIFSIISLTYVKMSYMSTFILMLIVHTIYEYNDLLCYYNVCDPNFHWIDNSFLNTIGDTLFSVLGFVLFIYLDVGDVYTLILLLILIVSIISVYVYGEIEM